MMAFAVMLRIPELPFSGALLLVVAVLVCGGTWLAGKWATSDD
jgi:hypothetical protein